MIEDSSRVENQFPSESSHTGSLSRELEGVRSPTFALLGRMIPPRILPALLLLLLLPRYFLHANGALDSLFTELRPATSSASSAAPAKQVLYLGVPSPISGLMGSPGALLNIAGQMAIDSIEASPSILPGVDLRLLVFDSECTVAPVSDIPRARWSLHSSAHRPTPRITTASAYVYSPYTPP